MIINKGGVEVHHRDLIHIWTAAQNPRITVHCDATAFYCQIQAGCTYDEFISVGYGDVSMSNLTAEMIPLISRELQLMWNMIEEDCLPKDPKKALPMLLEMVETANNVYKYLVRKENGEQNDTN